ncbi:MAG: hypothetical protein HYT10_00205 [Candidatus Levybacteria bacterium]|nr:hypothetical protein [Candidatus Levybacteria bacterium]
MMPKKFVLFILIIALTVISVMFFYYFQKRSPLLSPVADDIKKIIQKPLDKYTFGLLRKKVFTPTPIKIEKTLSETSQTQTWICRSKRVQKRYRYTAYCG